MSVLQSFSRRARALLGSSRGGGIARAKRPSEPGSARRRSRAGGKRGMALILVLSSIAILTAIAVDFAYNTQVDTRLAVNARDELRAYYLARSATNLSRLLLSFQHRLDGQMGGASQAIGNALGGGAGDAAAAAGLSGLGGLGGIGNIRIWEAIPMDSSAITAFVEATSGGGSGEEPPLAPLHPEPGEAFPVAGLASFGSFEGGFFAEISDEDSKINLNKIDNPGTRGMIAATQFLNLLIDPRWDFLFDEPTSHGERHTREELLVRIRDWIDADEVETNLNLTSPTELFVQGFGDEEGPYTRYTPRYRPKNALFDSMDELYMVAGITDRFMAAFGNSLTVYPNINSKLNVNTNDPLQQLMLIRDAAVDPLSPALNNPIVIEEILEQIAMVRMLGPMMGMTVQQFVSILEANGIAVRPEIRHNPAQNDYLGDKSETFMIRATGQAGMVSKTLVSVVRYDEGLGRLLYYREE